VPTDKERDDKDAVIRIAEMVLLVPLTLGFLMVTRVIIAHWVASDEVFAGDVGQWLHLGGFWGLISMWWLVLGVRPQRAMLRAPWLLWPGLALGVTYMIALMYLLFERPGEGVWRWFICAIYLVPLAILTERLRAYRRYRAGSGKP